MDPCCKPFNMSFESWKQFTFSTSPLILILLLIVSSLLISAILLYIFQGKLIYIPQLPPGSRVEVWLPSKFGYGPGKIKFDRSVLARNPKKDDDHACCQHDSSEAENCENSDDFSWEEVELITPDKIKLQAYWLKAPSQTNHKLNKSNSIVHNRINITNTNTTTVPYTVLFMQANAGNIGHRIPIARKLQEIIDCNVLLLSYRGYGKSTGTPSESGIKIDSQTALNYVWNILNEAERARIIVYGQSIGGAVAISLAHANPTKIQTLIVENTFLSIPSLIPEVAPVLGPFAFLCTEKWNSSALIPKIRQKALFLSGLKDELIPPSHMADLHKSARSTPHKRIVHFKNGTHNDTCVQPGYFETIDEFIKSTPKTPRVLVEEVTDEEVEGGSIR